MADNEDNGPVEIWVDLEHHIVVPLDDDGDDYDDNYVRIQRGSLLLVRADGETEQIGEIEVWHIDGARAIDNKLDIVDGCGATLLRPAPLQFSRADDAEWMERMQMSEFTQDQKAAADGLFKYWMGLRLRRTKHPAVYCVIQ